MIFSLQRRFLVLLLLPVALILITVGSLGWVFARNFIFNQWVEITRMKLDKAAHQIGMRLEARLDMIRMIAKAEEGPDSALVQTYLIQQLLSKDGVRFVDIEIVDKPENGGFQSGEGPFTIASGESKYTMELCGDFGFCAPILQPEAPDRSLNIIRMIKDGDKRLSKRLTVRLSFDSFIAPLRHMDLLEGSSAVLVTSNGQMLAATDKGWKDRKQLGETGDKTELAVLKEIKEKGFGTVFSEGHPPETVAGFYKMPFINWYLLMFSKGEVILAPILLFRNYFAIAGIACLIVILALIRLSTRSVGRSISEISVAAAKVREGDYSVDLSIDRNDEIGRLGASFKEMIEGLRQRDLIEQTFGRYVDKKIAKELMSRPEALKLGGQKRTVTIMMSDLRNFTVISEKMPPEMVIKMLNRYFARMIAVIERHRGIIVDFFGDSVLVFFNGIRSDVSARALDAVTCALEMQQAMDGFLEENAEQGLPPVSMGIGVHTGEVIVGNIGTESRAKYGIVGADVNITDRIQATAAADKVVISDKTYELIKDKLRVSLEFKACLKGIEGEKRFYEIASIADECQGCL
jgi:adenylate cyclase